MHFFLSIPLMGQCVYTFAEYGLFLDSSIFLSSSVVIEVEFVLVAYELAFQCVGFMGHY